MKTFRRDRLRRLVEAGRVVLASSYSFDDQYGSDRTDKEMPVKMVATGGDRPEGTCCVRRDHFEGSGRAWENPNGTVTLIVHSNLNFTFKILPEAA